MKEVVDGGWGADCQNQMFHVPDLFETTILSPLSLSDEKHLYLNQNR